MTSITETWRREFRALRLLADQQERIELKEIEDAKRKLRVRAANPTLAAQIWQQNI